MIKLIRSIVFFTGLLFTVIALSMVLRREVGLLVELVVVVCKLAQMGPAEKDNWAFHRLGRELEGNAVVLVVVYGNQLVGHESLDSWVDDGFQASPLAFASKVDTLPD